MIAESGPLLIAYDLQRLPDCTEEDAAATLEKWRTLCPIMVEDHLRAPGSRCIASAGGGQCRRHSHRFATYSVCPRHHKVSGRDLECVAALERTRKEIIARAAKLQSMREKATREALFACHEINEIVRGALA